MYSNYQSSGSYPNPQQPPEHNRYQTYPYNRHNDYDNYGGFPYDRYSGKPCVNKIQALNMQWTRYGVIFYALLLFINALILFIAPSFYITSFIDLICLDIIICMCARLTMAMSEKNMWYPREYLIGAGVSIVLYYLLGSAARIFDSKPVAIIAGIAAIIFAGFTILAGREFANTYCGNLSRFGKALILFGCLVILGAFIEILDAFNSTPEEDEDLFQLLGSASYAYAILFSALIALVVYAALWPFRILAKMMSDHDEPTTAEEAMSDSAEHEKKGFSWQWFLIILISLIIARVIVYLIR